MFENYVQIAEMRGSEVDKEIVPAKYEPGGHFIGQFQVLAPRLEPHERHAHLNRPQLKLERALWRPILIDNDPPAT